MNPLRPDKPLRRLNRYYKRNPGFKEWVQANEAWFRRNPQVFQQMMNDPNMVNLFVDLMTMNRGSISHKLKRYMKARGKRD